MQGQTDCRCLFREAVCALSVEAAISILIFIGIRVVPTARTDDMFILDRTVVSVLCGLISLLMIYYITMASFMIAYYIILLQQPLI